MGSGDGGGVRPDYQEWVDRSCNTKVRYEDRESAVRVAKRREAAWGSPLRVYACGICTGWHLTKSEANGGEPRCGLCLETFRATRREQWMCDMCENGGQGG